MSAISIDMIAVDAGYMIDKLATDGLQGLETILQNHNLCIAGSYVLPYFTEVDEYVPDIDIWIPFTPRQKEGVAAIVAFCYVHGYELPRVSYSNRGTRPKHDDPYKRIRFMMSSIISMKSRQPGKKCVQILVMNSRGGAHANDIIAHFDVTPVMQYYDGKQIWASPDALLAMKDKTIRINTRSDIITQQSFPEWVRTLARIKKYNARGFIADADLMKVLGMQVSECMKRSIAIVDHAQNPLIQRIPFESYMDQWNILSTLIDWADKSLLPSVALAVRAPGNTWEDLYICVLHGAPVEKVAWEMKEVQQYSGYFIRAQSATRLDVRYRRIIEWDGRHHLISTIVPFPVVRPCCSDITFVDPKAPVFDHITLIRTRVQDYIDTDPGNNFVCYVDCSPHTLTRQQCTFAKVFLPCVKPNSADRRGIDMVHKSVITICLPAGNFYVPSIQMQEILDVPGSCRIQLIPTGLKWDSSTLFIRTEDERFMINNDYIGGISQNGGPTSSLTIYYICRLP